MSRRSSIAGHRFTRPAVAASALLLTAAAVWLFAHEGHAPVLARGVRVDAAKGLIGLTRAARDALDVRTAEVAVRPVADEFTAYATLVPPWTGRAVASARLAGRVSAVHVRAGQSITVGQVLAEVESLELETLRADVLAAQADRDVAAKVAEHLGAGVSEQSRLEARAKLRQAEIALEVVRDKWASLGLDVKSLDTSIALPVRSPIPGTVTRATPAVGKVVEPAEPLFEVVDLSTVWVRIDVLEHDAHRVAVGQPVALTLTPPPARRLPRPSSSSVRTSTRGRTSSAPGRS